MDELTLEKKIEKSDPEIQEFIMALKKENLRLVKKIAKLQANKTTKENEMSLHTELSMTDDELKARIIELEQKISKLSSH